VSSSNASSLASESWEPPRPAVVALVVFVLAALALCWPMLLGRFLVSGQSDQYVAGYAFRSFGAEFFRAHHRIPEWNPYLFGGLPFIAAQHGDVFYPTAWLRWVLPVDTAMNLGFAVHLGIAGCTMYALLRALRTGWTGALVGGLGYELTGIVASLVKPGHDGKLFVSALAPLALLATLRAIRDRRWSGYGLLALTVGFCMLSPHYQMTYYLLVACGIWTLWLALWDPGRPEYLRRRGAAWGVVGLSFAAVLLGLAIAAIQIIPFLAYVPYSPRGSGGPSTGWEYATAFSMPPEEIVSTILPQFNGVLESYWGRNFFKLHTEFLGVGRRPDECVVAVVEAVREGMLRGQPVVGGQHQSTGAPRDLGASGVLGLEVPGHKGTAVEEDQRRGVLRAVGRVVAADDDVRGALPRGYHAVGHGRAMRIGPSGAQGLGEFECPAQCGADGDRVGVVEVRLEGGRPGEFRVCSVGDDEHRESRPFRGSGPQVWSAGLVRGSVSWVRSVDPVRDRGTGRPRSWLSGHVRPAGMHRAVRACRGRACPGPGRRWWGALRTTRRAPGRHCAP
jgi:hypothetical protein